MVKLIEDEQPEQKIPFYSVGIGKYFISRGELYHRAKSCNSNCARHVVSGEILSFLSDCEVVAVEITSIHYKTV